MTQINFKKDSMSATCLTISSRSIGLSYMDDDDDPGTGRFQYLGRTASTDVSAPAARLSSEQIKNLVQDFLLKT